MFKGFRSFLEQYAIMTTKCSSEKCNKNKQIKYACDVCKNKYCRECCKRYLALESAPAEQVLTCDSCYLKNVIWDSTKTYDVYGPADGKPVVLVHGALIGRHCLAPEARALADAGFRVIVPDLAAHGSRFKEEPLTLDNAVSTVYDVVTKEAPGQKVVVMGFSMGGYVAAAVAAKHPDLTAAVLMASCAHDTHNFTWKMVGKMAEFVYRVCSPKTKAGFIFNSYPDVMKKDDPVIQECFLRTGVDVDSWKYTWRVMYDANMKKLLPEIQCPALVVAGEKDFRSHEKVWLSLLKHGKLLVLKGGIHPFMYQPGIVEAYRKEAIAFANTAQWGKVGQVAENGVAENGDIAVAHDGIAVLAGPDGVEVLPPAGRGVGLGEVFRNLWMQRGSKKKGQPVQQ